MARLRLYLDQGLDAAEYVRRWEGPDVDRIRSYDPAEVQLSLWPWLKERGYATDADDGVFEGFLRILGRGKHTSGLDCIWIGGGRETKWKASPGKNSCPRSVKGSTGCSASLVNPGFLPRSWLPILMARGSQSAGREPSFSL
jgi:hypothetical protein